MKNYTALVPMGGQFKGLISLHEINASSITEAKEISADRFAKPAVVIEDSNHPELYGENQDIEALKIYKNDYEVFEFGSGSDAYYGISKKGTFGADLVLGGDSANEDDYNEEYMNEVYNNWNGELEGDEDSGFYISL